MRRGRNALIGAIDELMPRAREPGFRIALAEAEFRLAIAPDTEPDEGIERLWRAVRHNPFHALAHLHLGRLLHRRGRRHEAVSAYRKAIGIAPASRRAYVLAALALHDLGPEERSVGQRLLAAWADDSADRLAAAIRALDGLSGSPQRNEPGDTSDQRRSTRPGTSVEPAAWLRILVQTLSRPRLPRAVLDDQLDAGVQMVHEGRGISEFAVASVLLLVADEPPKAVRELLDRARLSGHATHPALVLSQLALELTDIEDQKAFVSSVSDYVGSRLIPPALASWLHVARHRMDPPSLSSALAILDGYPADVAALEELREARIAILDDYAQRAWSEERWGEARVIWQEVAMLDPLRVEVEFNLSLVAARTRSVEHYRPAWERLSELLYLRAAGARDLQWQLADRMTLHRAVSRQSECSHRQSTTEDHSDEEIADWISDPDSVEVWLREWDLYYLNARLQFRSARHVLGIGPEATATEVEEASETMGRLTVTCFRGRRWAGVRTFHALAVARLDEASAQARRMAVDSSHASSGGDPSFDGELAQAEPLLDEALRRALLLRRMAKASGSQRAARQQLLRCSIARRLFALPRAGLHRLCVDQGLIAPDTTLTAIFEDELLEAVERLAATKGRSAAPDIEARVAAARSCVQVAPHLPHLRLRLCELYLVADRSADAHAAALDALDAIPSPDAGRHDEIRNRLFSIAERTAGSSQPTARRPRRDAVRSDPPYMIELGAGSYYALLGISPDATAAEIRFARDQLIQALRQRARRESTNRDKLLERQKAINAAGEELARPARRTRYDADNPHLTYFTIRRAAAPMFVDRASRVEVILRASGRQLEAAGVGLAPLSDLDRADFSADCTPTPLLDD